jgi:hypothetical protein
MKGRVGRVGREGVGKDRDQKALPHRRGELGTAL